MFTNRDRKKYKEENIGIEKILPTHSTRRHRIFNAFTKKAFGTSVYTREELVSFFRSLIRINYYNCKGKYINNDGIVNTATYCKEDLDNFKLLGNKIKIKVTCEDNKMKEIKLKYFFRKMHDMGYYLKDTLVNDENVDKCMINDLLSFLKMNDIDIEKLLPHIMLGYKMLDNFHNLDQSKTGTKYVDELVSQNVDRTTKTKLTRRYSYKRPNQEGFGLCWAWASVRMVIKFIQNIIKYHPHNEILDIELSRNEMNYIYEFNNFTNFFKNLKLIIPDHNYNENNIKLKNITIYVFLVLLMDHYNHNNRIQLNDELLLNPTKETKKRGILGGMDFIRPFLKGIKNIKKTIQKLNFFNRFTFDKVQQNIIIEFFDEFQNYMNDYNYQINVKNFKINLTKIIEINDIDNFDVIIPKNEKNLMNIIDIIIDIIKDFNLYVYIGLDLAYLPFLINPKHLDKHPRHALVITRYNLKNNEFTIENSWGNKLSTFILTKKELIKTITDSNEFIIQYIYPLHYKGFFKGYKTVSKKFVQSTSSLNDDMYEPVKSKISHHRTSKRHTSKRSSSPEHKSPRDIFPKQSSLLD